MAEKTLFEQLKDVLTEFKDFLDENVDTIKPAIQQIASLVPQIKDLITQLADLLGKLRTEIQNLDVSNIPGLAVVSGLTAQIPALLDAAKKLLPNETAAIQSISEVTSVVTGLPSIEQVRAELLALLEAIIGHVNSLKA